MRGLFYPPEMPKRRWFAHYTEHFDTVEVNNTFYRVPGREVFESWRERAPAGFLYALKFSRFATHMKKLKDPEQTLGYFRERAEPLADIVGPILVQLPPGWGANPERLRAFLEQAPPPFRWTVELRDPSWLCDEVYDVLRELGASLCQHDMIPDHPRVLTAHWVYLRYHGTRYAGTYVPEALRAEAERIEAHLAAGRDVYAYFNNDIGGHAVYNALDLRALVRSHWTRKSPPAKQVGF